MKALLITLLLLATTSLFGGIKPGHVYNATEVTHHINGKRDIATLMTSDTGSSFKVVFTERIGFDGQTVIMAIGAHNMKPVAAKVVIVDNGRAVMSMRTDLVNQLKVADTVKIVIANETNTRQISTMFKL